MDAKSLETTTKVISPEEASSLIWDELLNWLNSSTPLPADVRDLFVERSSELRLRMQAVFMEIQRRYLTQIAGDIEHEEELRRDIRRALPYASFKEKTEALKLLNSETEARLKRLEQQMAGFDFFNTIEVSISTMSDIRVSKELANSVKAMPSDRRAQLLSMLTDMVKNMSDEEKKDLLLPKGTDE
jgi:hypothetical protein